MRDIGPEFTANVILKGLSEWKNKVFLICLGFTKNITDAEDLTQETFLRAYEKLGELKDVESAPVWIFRIAKNKCLDYYKKRKHAHRVFSIQTIAPFEMNDPEAKYLKREQIDKVKDAIRKLPKKYKEVFVLREYGDLTYKEIADVLRIREGTVMSRLNRARQKVEDRFKEDIHGEQE